MLSPHKNQCEPKSVDIEINSVLKNGDTIVENKNIRIKNLSKLVAKINGYGCGTKCLVLMRKNQLKNSELNIELENVLFDWKFDIIDFKINFKGSKRILYVKGNKITSKIAEELKHLKTGDKIQIFDFRFKSNAGIFAKNPAPILVEVY